MTRGELLELLERLEWGDHSCEESSVCPECEADEPYTTIHGEPKGGVHRDGCLMPAAIAELRAAGHLDAEIGELRIYDPSENDE